MVACPEWECLRYTARFRTEAQTDFFWLLFIAVRTGGPGRRPVRRKNRGSSAPVLAWLMSTLFGPESATDGRC